MKCVCSQCGKEVPYSILEHFTGSDGLIYCDSCYEGVEPCSEHDRNLIAKYELIDK
ncbi:hypothetical protein [Clostridium perfringens]|uniref:hypothetical protein n=1 Tax=Clostridium perfringens TaxID=1502 RepID=UPI0039E8B486